MARNKPDYIYEPLPFVIFSISMLFMGFMGTLGFQIMFNGFSFHKTELIRLDGVSADQAQKMIDNLPQATATQQEDHTNDGSWDMTIVDKIMTNDRDGNTHFRFELLWNQDDKSKDAVVVDDFVNSSCYYTFNKGDRIMFTRKGSTEYFKTIEVPLKKKS